MGSVRRFTPLLEATLEACQGLSQLVREIYTSADELVELKGDLSAFTIADGLVQDLLSKSFLKSGVGLKEIVGEEDVTSVNLTQLPYSVSNLEIPENLYGIIHETRGKLERIGDEFWQGKLETYKDCSVFIDPIDGTREFSSRQGEQCTILVGFAVNGQAKAGVVFRPIHTPPSWAIGSKDEDFYKCNLSDSSRTVSVTPNQHGLMTTNGSISHFLEELIAELGMWHGQSDIDTLRIRAGGVGNKIMNVLEGKGLCYISDRGVSRWDTCAAQAVLEAQGGHLFQLAPFLREKVVIPYKYQQTTVNLDFDPTVPVRLSRHNKMPSSLREENSFAVRAEDLKPYANVLGLVALDQRGMSELDQVHERCVRASTKHEPSFD